LNSTDLLEGFEFQGFEGFEFIGPEGFEYHGTEGFEYHGPEGVEYYASGGVEYYGGYETQSSGFTAQEFEQFREIYENLNTEIQQALCDYHQPVGELEQLQHDQVCNHHSQ